MPNKKNKKNLRLTLNDKLVLERYSNACTEFGGNCEMRLSDSRNALSDNIKKQGS